VPADTPPPPVRPKKIVICLDGTGNQVGASSPTNVVKFYELLDVSDPAELLAYYDPGVGTMYATAARPPVGRWLSRVLGLAFGTGLRENVAEAYTYLMQNWRPGDSVYVVGFSRGAYTARALVGMLTKPGLMRPGSENLVPYAVAKYATNHPSWKGIAAFAHAFCVRTENEPLFSTVKANDPKQISHHSVPVAYLGIWDTVKAAGVLRIGSLRWPYTRQLPNVARIRHAVSIDEHRRPYREYLVERAEGHTAGVEEAWFAGVHSDVGGTFEPDHRLASIALRWVVDGVKDELVLRPDAYDESCAVAPDYPNGTVHRMGWVWLLTGTRHRPVPDGAVLHQSVRLRQQAGPTYRPGLASGHSYCDTAWPG
jgi:uncharacterized protein (DUF2235 family)